MLQSVVSEAMDITMFSMQIRWLLWHGVSKNGLADWPHDCLQRNNSRTEKENDGSKNSAPKSSGKW